MYEKMLIFIRKLERMVLKMDFIKKYEKQLYIVLLLAVVAVLFLFSKEREYNEQSFFNESTPVEKTMQVEEKKKEEKKSSSIFVDVKGAVAHRGVYEVQETARVKDVIALAGGFTKEADQTKVNLAAKVHDEMVVYVPKIGEEMSEMVIATSGNSANNGDGKININTASLEEIQELDGIGPAKAAAIIAYREENGPFQKVEDLLNVTGIGEKSLEKIKEQVIVR
jgi:competence protein ComEA